MTIIQQIHLKGICQLTFIQTDGTVFRPSQYVTDFSLGKEVVTNNLDLSGPEDAARQLRLALSIGSVVTALFANSPFTAGAENGWASRRARI